MFLLEILQLFRFNVESRSETIDFGETTLYLEKLLFQQSHWWGISFEIGFTELGHLAIRLRIAAWEAPG